MTVNELYANLLLLIGALSLPTLAAFLTLVVAQKLRGGERRG